MDDSSSSSESEIAIDVPTISNTLPNTATEASNTASGDEEGKQQKKVPRRTHSVAHDDFVAETIVLFNVDLETVGTTAALFRYR